MKTIGQRSENKFGQTLAVGLMSTGPTGSDIGRTRSEQGGNQQDWVPP